MKFAKKMKTELIDKAKAHFSLTIELVKNMLPPAGNILFARSELHRSCAQVSKKIIFTSVS